MSLGHLVRQVWQEAQIQMVWEFSTRSRSPRRISLTICSGLRSMAKATGQPLEHLRHW